MKKYIYIFISALLLASCTDVLDHAPDGKLSMEEIWADPEMVEQMLNACYFNISTKGYSYQFWDPAVVACSDDAYSSEDGVGQIIGAFYTNSGSSSWHPFWSFTSPYGNFFDGQYWDRYWRQIRLTSQFLENIDEAAVFNEANRDRFKAEAHVLRAFFYMELIKWFGKLPVLEVTMPFDADYSELKRQSVYEVAKFIVYDCDEALRSNELPWRITVASDALRMTKALACALKVKAMLFAASPLHNEGQNYWEEAYQTAKTSIQQLKANGYQLYTTCTNPGLYGTGKAAALHQLVCENADIQAVPRDRETIFQHKQGDVFIWHIGYVGSNEDGTYKCGPGPTQELVDAFETDDGVPVLNLEKPYLDEFHLQPNYNTANTRYNRNSPYENRDPRFYISILYHGAQFIWNNGEVKTINTLPGGQHAPSFSTAVRENSRTGYLPKKLVTPGASASNQINCSRWKYYRLGETLLDYAEAAAEANHLADALEAVNEVRARSGMPALSSSLSQSELILRIHNERRIELNYEEQRFFDMRRWQKPDGDLGETSKYFTAMLVTQNSDGSLNFTRRSISESPRGGWQNKDLLLPIPLSECSNMEAITGDKWQNPGW